jgi:hypothetical protein
VDLYHFNCDMEDLNKLKDIEHILGEWNPINVPDFIEVDEYKTYAYEVFNNHKNELSIRKYLIFIFTKKMGYELTEQSNLDIINISKRISHVLQ